MRFFPKNKREKRISFNYVIWAKIDRKNCNKGTKTTYFFASLQLGNRVKDMENPVMTLGKKEKKEP